MLIKRPAHQRGTTEIGWLHSHHTFSFGGYQDPRHMGFGPLRVINDDVVEPGAGFGTHPHRDMEILTYVLEGGLSHEDSTGGGGVIVPGEVQVMTAGSGLTHSEFNSSQEQRAHFLQVWIQPRARGLQPHYDQRTFPIAEQPNEWHVIAAPADTADAPQALVINQDAIVRATQLNAATELELPTQPGRQYWLQVARGEGQLADLDLRAGDGVAVADEGVLTFMASTDAELLWFDLAADA